MRSHLPFVSLCAILPFFPTIVSADGGTVWDYAPDFSKDQIQPYPSLKNPDGSNITIDNLRGTRLFGYKGCGNDEANAIGEAYNDFYKLANQPVVYNNIDWTDQATKDFFGPNTAKSKIPDDTRAEIQQIFASAQQMYSFWWIWHPWWESPRQLWIEVRCSGGDGSGDPDNACGDKGNPPECPPPEGAPSGGAVQLEAYSDPENKRYSRITFCNKFFELPSLTDAVNQGKKKSSADQNNLEIWNNRARTFFHEATHLDYFMNAPKKSPYVSDTKFQYEYRGVKYNVEGYGPYNIKVLRNYVKQRWIGYYTQRNADTYAWFALAKYIQAQINRYPSDPSPGSIKPVKPPRDARGNPLAAGDADSKTQGDDGDDGDLIGTTEQPGDGQHAPGFSVPGCGDKFGQLDANSGGAAQDNPPPSPDAKCDLTKLSELPNNVFSGPNSSVYDKFCDAVGANQTIKLSWTVNANGNQTSPPSRLRRRTPPPDPDLYTTYNIDLDWEPITTSNQCDKVCKDAYTAIVASPCGHSGGTQDSMTTTASIDVGCGTYSYTIKNSGK